MKATLSFLLLLTSQFLVQAETSVWEVRSGNSTLYIGGTCHVLRASDFPLPEEFDAAYNKSAILFFETDLGRLREPSIQLSMLSKGMLKDDLTLDKVLSPEAYGQLKKYCESNDIPLAALVRLKPAMVMVTLAVMELQKLGASLEGVDFHYYTKGKKDGKRIAGFETAEEQIDMLISMGEGNEDAMVLNSLRDMKQTREMFEELILHWKKGDIEKLDQVMVSAIKKDYPKLYKTLIVERNNRWTPKIKAMLKTDEREFVLVGVAHLGGEDGVLDQLKRAGCQVTRLKIKN